MIVVGKVLRLEKASYDACPWLVLEPAGAPSGADSARYSVPNPEMVKVFRRTLATGDVIECNVMDMLHGAIVTSSFRIVERAPEQSGRVRELRVEYGEPGSNSSDAEYGEPEEIDPSEAEELRQGETVFSHAWDGNAPGHSGVIQIIRARGDYFYSGDEGMFGPFRTLLDAFHWNHLDTFSSATESIRCSELDVAELADLLAPRDDVPIGYRLEINGDRWELGASGRLVRAGPEN